MKSNCTSSYYIKLLCKLNNLAISYLPCNDENGIIITKTGRVYWLYVFWHIMKLNTILQIKSLLPTQAPFLPVPAQMCCFLAFHVRNWTRQALEHACLVTTGILTLWRYLGWCFGFVTPHPLTVSFLPTEIKKKRNLNLE